MATLNNIDLGNIQNETQIKDTALFVNPIPVSDSDAVFLLDIFGVSRTISIEGIITGTTTVLDDFIDNMEGIANGNQIGITFVSSLSTFDNKTVFIKSFRWSYVKAEVNKISYTLELIEGLAVA